VICSNPECGKEFEPSKYNKLGQKFCSSKCREKLRRIKNPKRCNKYTNDWAKRNREQINKKRQTRRQEKRKNTPLVNNNCMICGSSFSCNVRNPYQKYCSHKCLKRAEYLRDKEKINARNKNRYHNKYGKFNRLDDAQKIRICRCGNKFDVTMKGIRRIYCSKECLSRYLARDTRKDESAVLRIRKNANKYGKKATDGLYDNYIISLLTKGGTQRSLIQKKVIEQKRLVIKLKRKIHEITKQLNAR